MSNFMHYKNNATRRLQNSQSYTEHENLETLYVDYIKNVRRNVKTGAEAANKDALGIDDFFYEQTTSSNLLNFLERKIEEA